MDRAWLNRNCITINLMMCSRNTGKTQWNYAERWKTCSPTQEQNRFSTGRYQLKTQAASKCVHRPTEHTHTEAGRISSTVTGWHCVCKCQPEVWLCLRLSLASKKICVKLKCEKPFSVFLPTRELIKVRTRRAGDDGDHHRALRARTHSLTT